jgi:hypothetical protein
MWRVVRNARLVISCLTRSQSFKLQMRPARRIANGISSPSPVRCFFYAAYQTQKVYNPACSDTGTHEPLQPPAPAASSEQRATSNEHTLDPPVIPFDDHVRPQLSPPLPHPARRATPPHLEQFTAPARTRFQPLWRLQQKARRHVGIPARVSRHRKKLRTDAPYAQPPHEQATLELRRSAAGPSSRFAPPPRVLRCSYPLRIRVPAV